MEDEQYSDALECSKCGQNVDQILALQCDHNLCLLCSSKTISGQGKGDILNSIKCEICGVLTVLDPTSTQILYQIREQNFAFSQQDQYQHKVQQQNTYNSQQINQNNYNNFNKNLQSEGQSPNNKSINNPQHMMLDSQQTMIEYQDKQQMVSCREHQQEEAVLYCFTCETPCICVECCLNGLHKNHDLKNVSKNYDQLQDNVEDLRFKIKARADLLLNDECRITQKKRELIEVVSTAKSHIKNNFDELLQMIEQKQKELLQNADEMMEEKFQEIDKCLGKVRQNTKFLQDFDQKLEILYYRSEKTPENQARAFNFYSDHKPKMVQSLQDMDTNFFHQVQEKLHCEFVLDMQSLYQHIDSIRQVKIEVIALRGLEQTQPNKLETDFYQQAKEDRNKRKYETFAQKLNTNNSPNKSQINMTSNLDEYPSQINQLKETKNYENNQLNNSNQYQQLDNSFKNRINNFDQKKHEFSSNQKLLFEKSKENKIQAPQQQKSSQERIEALRNRMLK